MDNPVLQKVRFWLLVFLSISITLELSPAFIVVPALSIVIVIMTDRFDLRTTASRISGVGYFLALIFLIHAVWFVPHIVKTGSTKYLERTLPYLLFPLMLSSMQLRDEEVRKVLKIFIWSVAVSYVMSIVAAIYHYFYSVPVWGRASDFFFHDQFTKGLFNIHPTYYSLLGCLATLFAYLQIKGPGRIVLIGFLTIVIFAINAKITFVIQILLIISFIIHSFSTKFSMKRLIVVVVSIVAMFYVTRVISSIYDYPHRKLITNLEDSWTRSYAPDISDGDGGIVMRMAIWRSAWTVIKQNYIFGVGLGFEDRFLVDEYTKQGYAYLAGDAFNAHNQILSYLIGFGITGCALLGVVYFKLLHAAYLRRARFYFVFVAIFVCAAITESIFNRLLGVSMFAFFNTLLVLKIVNHDK